MRRAGSILLCSLWACGSGASADDCPLGACDTTTTGPGPTSGAGAQAGAGGSGGAASSCDTLCGSPAAPSPSAGIASFAPPGCQASGYERRFGFDLSSDGAKAVPQLADLDRDGKPDLVINARLTATAMVFAGAGDGTFSAPTPLPQGGMFAGGWGIDLGDIDQDGLLDLAAGDHVAGALAWLNEGGLGFALDTAGLPQVYFSGAGLGDVDGDGDLDAVFGADQFGSGLMLFHREPGGWSAQSAPALSGSSARNAGYFAFFDHGGDGDQDLVAFGQENGGIVAFVFENGPDGWSSLATSSGGTGSAIGMPVQGSIGDVDCDGAIDIAAGGAIHRGDGGSWSLSTEVDQAKISHFGDMNGDGRLDLVTHDEMSGLRVFLNDDGSFVETDLGLPDASYLPPELPDADVPLASAYGIDLADVNGDGRLDVARVLCASKTQSLSSVTHCYAEVWVSQR